MYIDSTVVHIQRHIFSCRFTWQIFSCQNWMCNDGNGLIFPQTLRILIWTFHLDDIMMVRLDLSTIFIVFNSSGAMYPTVFLASSIDMTLSLFFAELSKTEIRKSWDKDPCPWVCFAALYRYAQSLIHNGCVNTLGHERHLTQCHIAFPILSWLTYSRR